MFVTPAYAQAAGGALGDSSFLIQFAPFILIFVIMYFLLIRPQQRKAKEHRDMLKNLRRGDVVVMQGGLIGKIVKVVDESELLLDVGDGTAKVQVRVAAGLVQQLRTKGEPVKEGN
ncbi:MAG: preprotein translocase subunit YajC [Proteobacteria bacterium]|nr:preprotein translocase subunit YajC [Pseudomonadota bacterium]